MASSLPANPLPACPRSPNCARETRAFALDADALFEQARTALEDIGAAHIEADVAARRLDAVFRVFVFKDDVAVIVAPHETGSVLHVRSASRVGYSDLGVNRRRVNRLFDRLK